MSDKKEEEKLVLKTNYKLDLTKEMIQEIFEGSKGKTQLEHEILWQMKCIGCEEIAKTKDLEKLTKKVKKRMELRTGNWTIKPAYKSIGKGLFELITKKKADKLKKSPVILIEYTW